MLDCIVLYDIVMYCITLDYDVFCWIALHFSALNCFALYCIVSPVLHCTALLCSALDCIALYCIALHCFFIVLYRTSLLFCIVFADHKQQKLIGYLSKHTRVV